MMTNHAAYFDSLQVTIDPSQIGFLRFILEGYDGMSIVSTIDRHKGVVIIRYVHTFHNDLLHILEQFNSPAKPH